MANRRRPRILAAPACLGAALLVLAAPAGCARKDLEPTRLAVRAAVMPWQGSGALYVALDKGFFAAESLDVTLTPYPHGRASLDAVLAGRADMAAVAETPLTQAILQDRPVGILASLCRVERAHMVVARGDRGIASVEDLRGKRVGVVLGTSAEYYLHLLLTTSYVPAGEVQVTPLAQDDLLPSLSGGEVDAISTWIPRATLAQAALGPTAVVLDEPGLYTATWNLVGERTAVATDPDRFERFLRAVVRANRFLAEHPGEAQAITARHAGLDLDQVRERWDDHAFGAVLDRALVLHLEDQARWLLERSAPGTPVPDVRRHLAADPLRAARPGAVQLPWTEE